MRLMRFTRPAAWEWSPLNRITSLHNELNRLIGGATQNETELFNAWAPTLDLFEDKDSLIVRAEVPGLKKEEIDISLHEGKLTISGERKEEKQDSENEIQRDERNFGRFQRTIGIPKEVDAASVKAAYKDGVLTINLPKKPETKPKQIEVNVN